MSDQVPPSDSSPSTESGELVGEARRSRAIRGSAITVIGYGASQIIRLGTNIVLAALLFPEAFGIMALVWVFQQGLAMFSDIGIGTGIIYSKHGDDPRYLNTAWTTQVVRGVVLTLIAVAGAIPYAAFYEHRPRSAVAGARDRADGTDRRLQLDQVLHSDASPPARSADVDSRSPAPAAVAAS